MFQENALENLNTAFDVADRYLDIPRMLDAEGNYVKIMKLFHLCTSRMMRVYGGCKYRMV